MNNTLRVFYNNENERETVKLFMIEALKELAWEASFKGESTEGISDARKMIDKMFSKLEDLFKEKPKAIDVNSR